MRFIPTRVHGALDYLGVIALCALPRLLHWNGPTTTLMTTVGIILLLSSLLTRYELGLLRVIPMPVHLALDALAGLLLCAAPYFLLRGASPTAVTALIVLGLFEIGAAITTKTHTSLKEAEAPVSQHSEPHPSV